MRKIAVIGISILSIFILCSLSYQPMIADTPIEEIKETKTSISKIDKLRELQKQIVELKSLSNNDCGCSSDISTRFPIICGILLIFAVIIYIPATIFSFLNLEFLLNLLTIPGGILMTIWNFLGCPIDYPHYNLL